MTINDVIAMAIIKKATDIHLQEGHPVMLRIGMELTSLQNWFVTKEELRCWLLAQGWNNRTGDSLSAEWDEKVRLRIQLCQAYGGFYADIRILYPLSSLPADGDEKLLQRLACCSDGLILICGPTGCGKTTALWRMIQYLNDHKKYHIITLEDPIEIILEEGGSLITQRELHCHFTSFPQAVCQALRQDPDVILIGEMRDQETMDAALTAAETGHLVLSTLHTRSAAQAITRFVGAYPGSRQEEIRYRLSQVLQAILAQQRLCRQQDTCIVREVLLRTHAVSQLIRTGREHQLPSLMQMGAAMGMRTMEQACQGRI